MSLRGQLLITGLLLLRMAPAVAQTTPPKDKESVRPPQVRTYTTVTVVDDPSKAPRLPTQKQQPSPQPPVPSSAKEQFRATTPAQLREGLGTPNHDVKSETKAPAPLTAPTTERRNLESLRQDLRATARELRDAGRRAPLRELNPPTGPNPQPPRPSPNREADPRLEQRTLPPPRLPERLNREN
jgi:hypothetical protein